PPAAARPRADHPPGPRTLHAREAAPAAGVPGPPRPGDGPRPAEPGHRLVGTRASCGATGPPARGWAVRPAGGARTAGAAGDFRGGGGRRGTADRPGPVPPAP